MQPPLLHPLFHDPLPPSDTDIISGGSQRAFTVTVFPWNANQSAEGGKEGSVLKRRTYRSTSAPAKKELRLKLGGTGRTGEADEEKGGVDGWMAM